MDADVGKLHTPEAAAEAVDEGCRRVRERGQIAIVRSATSVDKSGQCMQSVERPILAALMGHSTGCAVFRSRLFAFIHSGELLSGAKLVQLTDGRVTNGLICFISYQLMTTYLPQYPVAKRLDLGSA
jgi:hypothetical protein